MGSEEIPYNSAPHDHHGFCYGYSRLSGHSKDIFLFETCVRLTEAARHVGQHFASRFARSTLPKPSTRVPSGLVVVQASSPALLMLRRAHTTIVDTYRHCTPFLVIFPSWTRLHTIGEPFLDVMRAAYVDALRRRLLQTKDGGTLSDYPSQCRGALLIVAIEASILHRLLQIVSSQMTHQSS
jgi:hypothetical protein